VSQIDRLCDQVGVNIVSPFKRFRPGQTRARRVLKKLLRQHGEGHLVFVLKTIVESRNNRHELFSETIMAVSDIVLNRPDLAEQGLAFIEAFDDIPLGEVREKARRMALGSKRQVMRVLIADQLERALAAPESQGKLL